MPTVRPFRALRYDQATVGPLDALVAPPYDVISDDARLEYLERSPYNVVHLTLPDSEEQAADDLRAWREQGVLVEADRAVWWVAQDYVGPDGVARTREGFAASVPGDAVRGRRGAAARADARRPEGRPPAPAARDAHPARADLPALRRRPRARRARRRARPRRRGGRRPHRVPGTCRAASSTIDTPLLIADGHHRYETAVAYREEEPSATHTFAILVSARAPGVEIFPTHRLVQELGDVPGEEVAVPGDGRHALPRRPLHARRDRRRLRPARRRVVRTREASRYTAYANEAIAAVDRGDADGRVPAAAGDRRAGRALRACAARRCRRSRRSSSRS